jgi:putative resolvase
MKLSIWAKKNSVTYRTAYSLYKAGKIENAYSLGSGTIVVPDESIKIKNDYIVTYARVSSSENKTNLLSQSKRLCDFCAAKGWIVSESIEEIGSGLNDHRPKLIKLLKENKTTRIVVEHKDRLTRFGFEYIKTLFSGEIIVINETETAKEDLIQDFISIITSFCARIYGQRRSKRKTEKLIKELQSDNDDS